MTADALQPKPFRIWSLYCPFKKSGVPSMGTFGTNIRPVIVIPVETWNRMCAVIPGLATTQFEVGAEE